MTSQRRSLSWPIDLFHHGLVVVWAGIVKFLYTFFGIQALRYVAKAFLVMTYKFNEPWCYWWFGPGIIYYGFIVHIYKMTFVLTLGRFVTSQIRSWSWPTYILNHGEFHGADGGYFGRGSWWMTQRCWHRLITLARDDAMSMSERERDRLVLLMSMGFYKPDTYSVNCGLGYRCWVYMLPYYFGFDTNTEHVKI